MAFSYTPGIMYLTFKQKPAKVTANPRMKFLDVKEENNIKMVK